MTARKRIAIALAVVLYFSGAVAGATILRPSCGPGFCGVLSDNWIWHYLPRVTLFLVYAGVAALPPLILAARLFARRFGPALTRLSLPRRQP